jgi:hypothetical protein
MSILDITDILYEILCFLNREYYSLVAPVSKKWNLLIKKLKLKDFLNWMPEILLPDHLQYCLYNICEAPVLLPTITYDCDVYAIGTCIHAKWQIIKYDMIINIYHDLPINIFKSYYGKLTDQIYDIIYRCDFCHIRKSWNVNDDCKHRYNKRYEVTNDYKKINLPLRFYQLSNKILISVEANGYGSFSLDKFKKHKLFEWNNANPNENQKNLLLSIFQKLI